MTANVCQAFNGYVFQVKQSRCWIRASSKISLYNAPFWIFRKNIRLVVHGIRQEITSQYPTYDIQIILIHLQSLSQSYSDLSRKDTSQFSLIINLVACRDFNRRVVI